MRIRLVKRKNPQKKEEEKLHASPVNVGKKTLRDIARDIAGRSALTLGDVESVLTNLTECLPGYLRDGHSVQLGDFGTVRVTLSSAGADTPKAFKIESIKPRVSFLAGVELKKQLRDIPFETVKPKDEEDTKEKKKPEEGGGMTP